MPGTRTTMQLPGGGVAVQLDQALTAIGVTDWVYVSSRVEVQSTGVATAVTIQVERSTADPVGTANPAPVGAAASGNPATGMQVLTFDEAGAAWWRVRVTALTGASVAISIGGRGVATPAAIVPDRSVPPRLARLRLSSSLATAGTNFSADVLGAAAGSQLILSRNPGGRWSLTGSVLTGKGLAYGNDTPAVTELPGTSGALAPRETEFDVKVAHDPGIAAFTRPWGGGASPTISLSANVTKAEGNSGPNLYAFSVTISAPAPTGGLVVPVTFNAGSTNAADYSSGVLPSITSATIPAGQVTVALPAISVNGDTDVESTESASLTISAPAGYTLLTATAWLTITNDDSGGIATTFASSVNQVDNSADTQARTGKIDRWPHYLPKACTEIVFAWRNWRLSSASTGGLVDTGNTLPITSAMAECNGVAVALTFDGAATRTVADGENDVRCQVLTPAMFGLSGAFPAGTTIWTKTVVALGDAAHSIPFSPRSVADTTGSQSDFYDPAVTTLANIAGTGAFTSTGTSRTGRTSGWMPWCLGKLETAGKVWLARGDSITANTGDATANRDGRGWYQLVCSTLQLPCANLAVHGSSTLAGTTDSRLSYWYGFANRGVVFYGTNDLGNAGTTQTLATVQTRLTNLRGQMAAGGITVVGVHELLVRRSSTDLWATEANQSVGTFTNWIAGGRPDLLNQSLASLGFDFVLTGSSVRGTDAWNWKVNGSARAFAFDDTHPSTGGATALAAEAQSAMAAA